MALSNAIFYLSMFESANTYILFLSGDIKHTYDLISIYVCIYGYKRNLSHYGFLRILLIYT